MKQLTHETSEVKAHAKYSASGSSRWMNCPGSIALSESAPPQRESEYAAEGTEAHACLELLLKNRGRIREATKLAEKSYSHEMIEHALGALNWIEKRYSEIEGSKFVLAETKVDASPYTCEGQFGTLDAAIVEDFGRLIVIDYKYGAGVAVDPENNSQLIYYALGISNMYDHNFTEVELVIIQPRAFHESGETTRSWVCSIDELISWEQKFRDAVEATQDETAPLRSGSWCKFCPAALMCPEIKNKAMEQAAIVFDDETGVDSIPEPKSIAIDNLGTILEGCEKLETWIEKVKEHAIHVLERGQEVPGYKLVNKNSPRRWIDADMTAKTFTKKRMQKYAFAEPKLLSPAQLEKVFPAMKQWITTQVTNESSGTTMVPESDKRPAVNPAADAFLSIPIPNNGPYTYEIYRPKPGDQWSDPKKKALIDLTKITAKELDGAIQADRDKNPGRKYHGKSKLVRYTKYENKKGVLTPKKKQDKKTKTVSKVSNKKRNK